MTMLKLAVFKIALLFTFTVSSAGVAAAPAEQPRLEANGIVLTFDKNDGYTIAVDGIPFSGGAQLSITDPDWQQAYYTYSKDANRLKEIREFTAASQDDGPPGVTTVLRDVGSNIADTTQTVSILPGRRIRVSVECRPTTDTALLLENRIASIAEHWVANCPFNAAFPDGRTTSGRISAWPVSAAPDESKVAEGFAFLEIDSPYGPLTIETTGTAEFTLMDYRLNPWASGQRYFWFGVLGTRLPAAGLNYQVTIQFPPARSQEHVFEIAAAQPIIKNQVVYEFQHPADSVLPTPKTITWRKEDLPLGKSIPLHLEVQLQKHVTHRTHEVQMKPWEPPGLLEDAATVIDQFSKRWQDKYNLSLKVAAPDERTTATITFSHQWDLLPDQKKEIYSLDIDEDRIAINAHTAVGLRNALATVEQLFRHGSDGALFLRGVSILDYPSLPFRGIHFFTGRDAGPLQQKMIREVLAPLKINKLVYQVDYLEWDSLPKPHDARYSMAKAEAKEVADAARSAGIEVIPLVNTFGHSEWLLKRPALRHLADDPANPYAYDPSNPEIYRVCEGIYNETIDLFHPRTIHIGHDEVTMHGFPTKPANKAVGATKLLINDILHYHKYLAGRGIQTMIWGDMFLGPGESPDACLAPTVAEARRRRGLLPKDIVIADWHYRPAAPSEYKSLEIFTEEGFETIACTWDQAKNIANFAEAAAEQWEVTTASRGLLQTTWAGYSFDQHSLKNSFDQYAAYVMAAQAAWTGGAGESNELDYRSEFLRRWNQPSAGGSRFGWQINMDGVANTALTTATAQRLGVAPQAFTSLKPGVNQLGGYQFRLAENQGKAAVLLTSGPVHLTNINSYGQVVLALSSAFSAPGGTILGQVILTADDDSTSTVALVYGENIFGIGDPGVSLQSPVIWRTPDTKENEGAAYIHLLRMPVPDGKRLKSIRIAPASLSDIILFGMSGAKLKEGQE